MPSIYLTVRPIDWLTDGTLSSSDLYFGVNPTDGRGWRSSCVFFPPWIFFSSMRRRQGEGRREDHGGKMERRREELFLAPFCLPYNCPFIFSIFPPSLPRLPLSLSVSLAFSLPVSLSLFLYMCMCVSLYNLFVIPKISVMTDRYSDRQTDGQIDRGNCRSRRRRSADKNASSAFSVMRQESPQHHRQWGGRSAKFSLLANQKKYAWQNDAKKWQKSSLILNTADTFRMWIHFDGRKRVDLCISVCA